MSDEARTPHASPAPDGQDRPQAQPQAPLPGGVMAAAGAPSGGEWGELSDAVFSIWTRPRTTMRRIVTVDPRYGVVLLAALSGSSASLMRLPVEAAPSFGLLATLILACTLGPLFGIATLWIAAWIVRGVGRWLLGGQATLEATRAAVAWAYVPQVALLPLALLTTLVFVPATGAVRTTTYLGGPVAVNGAAPPPMTMFGLLFLVVWGLLSFTLAFWSVYIASNTVAEVQGYRSAWKGLGNLLLPLGLVMLIGVVLAILIPLAPRR